LIGLNRALIALAVVAFGEGVLVVLVVLSSDHTDYPGAFAATGLMIGWSFAGAGLYAWWRQPANRFGSYMTAVGLAWMLSGLGAANAGGPFVAGHLVGATAWGFLTMMLLSYPTGHLTDRWDRRIVAGAWVDVLLFPALAMPFFEPRTFDEGSCSECPANPLMVTADNDVAGLMFSLQGVVGIALIAALLVRMRSHYRGWPDNERRAFAPVLWAGGLALVLEAVGLGTRISGASEETLSRVWLVIMLPFAALPWAFLAGLLRGRFSEIEHENVRLDAELRERLEELRESRARIVRAGDEERRRIERDLHDGAQQRLVSLALQLRLARSKASGEAAELLDEALEELAAATAELRELARGIHPAILSDRGLDAAVRALAARAPVPVEVRGIPEERLPAAVETAAYFVVAESLTNVARYAGAEHAEVAVARANGSVVVEVHDNGCGGADPASGSGLRGLADRVAALDGRLEVDSPAGAGTTVRARIPCES
jgi:signal transduction histidine kinase